MSHRLHAFRKKHNGKTQLTAVINIWIRILDKGGQTDRFIQDFEKAFDPTHAPSLPHELLKSKIFSYGIGGKTLRCIDSLLCYRKNNKKTKTKKKKKQKNKKKRAVVNGKTSE